MKGGEEGEKKDNKRGSVKKKRWALMRSDRKGEKRKRKNQIEKKKKKKKKKEKNTHHRSS